MNVWLVVSALCAAALAQRVALPPRLQAEGVAHAAGSLFFAAEFRTGAVFLIDVATGFASTVVRPQRGRFALGLAARNGTLFVSGGGSLGAFGAPPRMFVYDILSGGTVAACVAPEGAVVNDVTVDERFAYYTDSALGQVYQLRLAALPACQLHTLPLPRDAFPRAPGLFTANGIVRFASGLVVANTNAANLFFVDLRTNAVQQILAPNSVRGVDGLEIYAHARAQRATLFVVQNRENVVSVWRLRRVGKHVNARFVRNITSPTFDTPTTAALGGGRLVVTNARFRTFSFGEELPDDAQFSLSAFRLRRRAAFRKC